MLVLAVFGLIFGMLLTGGVSADVNLALDGTASFNALGGVGGITWHNIASDVNDDSQATKVGFSVTGPTGATGSAKYEAIVELKEIAEVINKVSYYRAWSLEGHGAPMDGYDKTYLWYNGQWNLINTKSFSGEGAYTETIEITAGGPWNNVAKVKVEGFCQAHDQSTPHTDHYLFELRAWGPVACGDGTCDADETCGDTDISPECNLDCGACPETYSCSSSDDIILKLHSSTNSHGALWNDTIYNYDICCEDIFGIEAAECNGVHTCTGNNEVLRLNNTSNAHAQTPYSSFTTVELTIPDLRYNFNFNHSQETQYEACKFPFKFKGDVNHPLYIEIRDSDNNLVGTRKTITTDRFWEYGDVVTSNLVELIPGASYQFVIWSNKARMFDTPFFDAYGVHVLGDSEGIGGYDFGGIAEQNEFLQETVKWKNIVGPLIITGTQYTTYYCDGTPVPSDDYWYEWNYLDSNIYAIGYKEWEEKTANYPLKGETLCRPKNPELKQFDNWDAFPSDTGLGINRFGEKVEKVYTFTAGEQSAIIDFIPFSPYTVPVCYGDLECEAKTDPDPCSTDYEVVIRLYQDTNSHISNASDTNFLIKICCKQEVVIPTGNVYWADMQGNPITDAEIGDSVLMIYQDMAGQNYDFEVWENDRLFDDYIRSVTESFDFGVDLAAKWVITQEDWEKDIISDPEFVFVVDSITSENLIVPEDSFANSPPLTQIIKPVAETDYVIRQGDVSTNTISFEQISSDVDDDLKISWNFGDSASVKLENCLSGTNCNTTHQYTASGTKNIILTASEMAPRTPAQFIKDFSRIYVYDGGITAFVVMDYVVNERMVTIDSTQTHVSDCDYLQATCENKYGAGNCYQIIDEINPVDFVWCYDLVLRVDGIDSNPNLFLDWTANGIAFTPNRVGNGMKYIKIFEEPGDYIINLGVRYKL